MTKPEIEKTIKVMTEFKRSGQFRAFWATFDQSVNLMASGEVVTQSMIAPAVAAVRSRGIPCTLQPLKEGYRGWACAFDVMNYVSGLKLDRFCGYLNSYTSGVQGAFIAREVYYAAQPDTVRKFLTTSEWDNRYGGKPVTKDILNPFGKVMERLGARRDGGSFRDRLGNIAAWNAVMDEDRYLMRLWRQFVTSWSNLGKQRRSPPRGNSAARFLRKLPSSQRFRRKPVLARDVKARATDATGGPS